MLSIEKCRKLIDGSEEYTDKQIEEIRTTLYGLAELALDAYFEEKKAPKNTGKHSRLGGPK